MTFTLCHNFIILLFRRQCYTFPSAADSARKFSLSISFLSALYCSKPSPSSSSLLFWHSFSLPPTKKFSCFLFFSFFHKTNYECNSFGLVCWLKPAKNLRKTVEKCILCVNTASTQCTNYWTNKRAAPTVWRVRAYTRARFLFGFEKRFSRHVNSLLCVFFFRE